MATFFIFCRSACVQRKRRNIDLKGGILVGSFWLFLQNCSQMHMFTCIQLYDRVMASASNLHQSFLYVSKYLFIRKTQLQKKITGWLKPTVHCVCYPSLKLRYLEDFYNGGRIILPCIIESASICNWVTFCSSHIVIVSNLPKKHAD